MVDGQVVSTITGGTEITTQPFFEAGPVPTLNIELQPEPGFVFPSFPELNVNEKPVIIDIETTDINPWEGRLIAIGALDLTAEPMEPITFIGESELQTLQQFLTWYEDKGFTQIIAFNGSFDKRWLFAVAMKNRIQAPTFLNTDIYDMQQVLKQVFTEFVFGSNRSGTLNDWAQYLLGLEKLGTIEELFDAWEKRDFDFITRYNQQDLLITAQLYLLDQFAKAFISIAPVQSVVGNTNSNPGNPSNNPSDKNTSHLRTINCPTCIQETEVPVGADEFDCEICNQKRPVPK